MPHTWRDMEWKRQMEHEAVAIAIPAWDWRDDDVVDIDMSYEKAWSYSEYTAGGGTFDITVQVWRADADRFAGDGNSARYSYDQEDSPQFWSRLMSGEGARLIEAKANPPAPEPVVPPRRGATRAPATTSTRRRPSWRDHDEF